MKVRLSDAEKKVKSLKYELHKAHSRLEKGHAEYLEEVFRGTNFHWQDGH